MVVGRAGPEDRLSQAQGMSTAQQPVRVRVRRIVELEKHTLSARPWADTEKCGSGWCAQCDAHLSRVQGVYTAHGVPWQEYAIDTDAGIGHCDVRQSHRHAEDDEKGAHDERGESPGQTECERQGRDPSTVSITVADAKPDLDSFRSLEAEGVERVTLSVPVGSRDDTLRLLDRYGELARAAA